MFIVKYNEDRRIHLFDQREKVINTQSDLLRGDESSRYQIDKSCLSKSSS